MNVFLTIIEWFLIWLFIAFLAALALAPILEKNSRRYPKP